MLVLHPRFPITLPADDGQAPPRSKPSGCGSAALAAPASRTRSDRSADNRPGANDHRTRSAAPAANRQDRRQSRSRRLRERGCWTSGRSRWAVVDGLTSPARQYQRTRDTAGLLRVESRHGLARLLTVSANWPIRLSSSFSWLQTLLTPQPLSRLRSAALRLPPLAKRRPTK